MDILLLGSGGREHAIARAFKKTSHLHIAPGNPGMRNLGEIHDLDMMNPAAVAEKAVELGVDLVVIGPEAPLVAGVADAVREAGIPVFGPSAAAAQLEGSKAFAKQVMQDAGVPTAEARVCVTLDEVAQALDTFGAPYVVKDDGLAAGKGVVVTLDRQVALEHAAACLEKEGGRVVVEDYLDGPEVSLFCICDGKIAIPLEPAQDFKRAYDANEGPNTGGMGAYSPLPWAPEGLVEEVVRTVAQPVVDEMARRGTPFIGVLYCGLALTSRGLRVVEFNVRFGDPETQSVLARLVTPLAPILEAAARGDLGERRLEWLDSAAVTLVLAASGYPGTVRSGDVISGIDEAESVEGAHVIHAGTALCGGENKGSGTGEEIVSAGGRVLATVGLGETVESARTTAYAAMAKISLDGSHYRSDIAAGI